MSNNQKTIHAHEIYLNAISFLAATRALSMAGKEGVDKLLLHCPTVVCEAFALELLLKCLREIKGLASGKTHDPEVLFASLSPDDQRRIDQHYQRIVQRHPQHHLAITHGLDLTTGSVLLRSKDTFKKIRYGHEGNRPSADNSGKISNAGAGSLCDAIKELIDELHPECQEMEISIPGLIENLPMPQ